LSSAPTKPLSAKERVAARHKAMQAAEARAVAAAKAAPPPPEPERPKDGATSPPVKGVKLGQAKKATITRRQRWTMTVGPATIGLVLTAFILIGGWAAAATGFVIFGDKLSAQLVAQQSDMQFAYEQKLVVFRTQLDRFARQARLQQDGVEGRIADLMLRQAALEARQAMLIALADQTRAPGTTSTQFGEASGAPTKAAAIQRPPASSFTIMDASHPPPERVAYLEQAIDRVENSQLGTLNGLTRRSQDTLLRLRSAFSDVGLDAEKFVPTAALVRGQVATLVPETKDFGGGPFESNIALVRRTLSVLGRLRTAAGAVPFYRPIPGSAGLMTSSYGTRSDPFTGEARFHAGTDFRSPIGVPVHAGGSGVVQTAGVGGGYGNLVVIDHGNNITTRYGHLSAINVTVGQPVAIGTVVGLVGSTGRSTGPHLHYETRINGEPHDPTRFIKSGELIY
jgi:murein DD-endopeptidase MepM/ murein hydrolase activator NlpD